MPLVFRKIRTAPVSYTHLIRLDYGDNRFVMCGDAEALAEADILENGIDISADVLKAGHHGSSTSTSEAFLDRVSPSVAVIQCGKDNSYGHPHKETLEKFKERGIQIYLSLIHI